MAIIYWKLGHLTAEGFQRPLDTFLVFLDGMVFDVDSRGWDLGIRPGQPLSEMKWRYPGATWVPWQPGYYQKLLGSLQEWLRRQAVTFQQGDPREGWWEWPRLAESDWRQLSDQVVPRWAQRMDAGVASHPWLAHWIAEEGTVLRLPVWSASFGETYILHPRREQWFWPQMPLRFVEGVPTKTRHQWHKRRFERVQDVPGLLAHIRSTRLWKGVDHLEDRTVTRRFEHPISAGVGEILRNLAEEVKELCQSENQGVQFMRITWIGEFGIERREREWPIAVGEANVVRARVLSLLNHPPQHPFEEVRLEVRLMSLQAAQMTWWDSARNVSRDIKAAQRVRFSPTRRELLLRYWDFWRMTEGDPE